MNLYIIASWKPYINSPFPPYINTLKFLSFWIEKQKTKHLETAVNMFSPFNYRFSSLCPFTMNIGNNSSVDKISVLGNIQSSLGRKHFAQPNKRVLIIHDMQKAKIGNNFVCAIRNLGAEVDVFIIGENRFLGDTYRDITQKIISGNYSVLINIMESRVEEIADRQRLINIELNSNAAIIHCPGIEESMLSIQIEYDEMLNKAKQLLDSFSGATELMLTTALGTELSITIKDRPLHDDVLPKEKGISNFPFGEVYCAPVEDSVNGTLIADGSAGSFGLLPQPLRFEVKNGRTVDLCWLHNPHENADLFKKIRRALFQDDWANVVGELGIGLAPYSICGNILQDEKVAGTIHLAFGKNTFFGGQNKSNSHIDFLVRSPELIVHYPDCPPLTIMRAGQLLI